MSEEQFHDEMGADLAPEADAETGDSTAGDSSGTRGWRSVWRIHFYSGIFAIPFIVIMALSGLVILYTQPIQDWTEGDVRTVDVPSGAAWTSFDAQAQAAEERFPDDPLLSMTKPMTAGHATGFGLESGRVAFVDPYSTEVLGSVNPDGGIVGFANRMHATLNNDTWTIKLPSPAAIWDDEPVMREYAVFDLFLELMGVWTIVLVLTGLFIWWPRRSRRSATSRSVGERIRQGGRPRWRELHGFSGVVLFAALLITVISGLGWSSYWGPTFTAVANEISPNTWTDAPASAVGERGDLDRLGNQLHWNTGDIPIPASYATEPDGSNPAPISLDSLVAIADEEGMKDGYTVFFPSNTVDDAGNPLFGSFTISNSWPRKTGEARDLFLDQFTGETLAEQNVYGYGSISRAMDTLVSVHMGTQLGLFTRIMMTGVVVLSLWSAASACVMFWKRRRKGTLGLPRRPVDVRLAKGVLAIAVAMAIVFPLWGATALVILALDRFVIRRVPRLRLAFGQR